MCYPASSYRFQQKHNEICCQCCCSQFIFLFYKKNAKLNLHTISGQTSLTKKHACFGVHPALSIQLTISVNVSFYGKSSINLNSAILHTICDFQISYINFSKYNSKKVTFNQARTSTIII